MRRGGSLGGGHADKKKRSVFTKLMKDKDAVMRDAYQAKRFLEGMETFDSKAELLAKLQDEREMGMKRVQDVLSFSNSTTDVETLLIPLLSHVLNEETSRPMFRPLRDRMLLAIYHIPNLFNVMVTNSVVEGLSQTAAECFCSYLRALTKPHLEPRASLIVQNLAKALRDRGDIDEARFLCSCLLLDGTEDNIQAAKLTAGANQSKRRPVACWVSDREPPGGRHDNDHLNYRDIRVVPTVEELACKMKPYLPLASAENNVIEDPVAALLDRNFRLLREDAVSSMRTNLAEAETKSWKNARIVDIHIATKRPKFSVSFVIQFDLRPNTSWKRSKSLMRGSVVALCKASRPVRLGTILVREDDIKEEWLNDPCGPKIGVTFESEDEFSDSIQEMVKNCSWNDKLFRLKDNCSKLGRKHPQRAALEEQISACSAQLETYDLVEVSKSFFAYRPILKTLQEMEAIPLAKELVASPQSSVPERPAYLPDELVLPEKDFDGARINLNDWSTDKVVATTTLDGSQAEALRHSLSSRVVLMQGPPGTGKTFMGALVSRVIRQNTDESILCVCYTNHALDQFLEHMLDAGEKDIVRIGGRSKSERLAGYQLRDLARTKSNTESFGSRRIKQVHAHLFKVKDSMEEIIKELKTPLGWLEPSGGIFAYLQDEEPHTLEFLKVPGTHGDENDGTFFKIVGPKGKDIGKDLLWECWQKGEGFPAWLLAHVWIDEDTDEVFEAFWAMALTDRMKRIEGWRREVLQTSIEELIERIGDFSTHAMEDQSLCRESELEILKGARIIGATTSGAASYHDLLTSKAAGVVLVEEAGEVLESHILTALSWGTDHTASSKHLILIGDHLQLPPKVENHRLTTTSGGGYNLDCSLFERLVLGGLPSVTLDVQHRMRPAISALIRSQTYPTLVDHESVTKYPEIKGVSENLLFIDHGVKEDGADAESTTKSNVYEANLCIEIVRFLLLQGYHTNQMVVLTPYLGQLLKITAKMKKELRDVEALVSDRDIEELEELETESGGNQLGAAPQQEKRGVRCSSIDNYQGEEADIIIISLVRSNKRGDIGFLKEPQRVNVLLSRARYGMYIIGNSATLLSSGKGRDVWGPLLEQLSASQRVLKGLPTTCQLHPDDEPVMLHQPKGFRDIRPNGGCSRLCTFRLSCGHACPLKCHPTDRAHEAAQRMCCEPCTRFPPECNRKHRCSKPCNEQCGPCHASVGRVTLVCGHVANDVMCYQVRSQEAFEKFSLECEKQVKYIFDCGHEEVTTCANSRSLQPKCPARCGGKGRCKHVCTKSCGSCSGNHDCNQTCSRTLFCGHTCGRPCHEPSKCSPCTEKCHLRCTHSVCPKKCNYPCSSCKERCDWQCEHMGACPLVCGAPCVRLPCGKRCTKTLECGHQCPSVCGEDCPPKAFCQVCGTAENLNQIVDMITMSSYAEHDVTKDPVVYLPCGHFFAMSTMDGVLEMHKVYQMDNSGEFIDVKSLRGSDINEKSKQCPDCRSIIHSISRYGRILRLIELRGLERKHMAHSDQSLQMTEKRIKDHLAKEQGNRDQKEKGRKQIAQVLTKLEDDIRKSPMRVVFEACGGSAEVESGAPPARQLIRCLQLRGFAFDQWTINFDDPNYNEAKRAYLNAMEVADASTSRRSGAQLRLSLARLILKFCVDVEAVRDEVSSLLDWILEESQLHVDHEHLVLDAQDLKEKLRHQNSLQTIQEIMTAMKTNSVGVGDGAYYDLGTSASSHWYECVNGHPYFIGECGGAMQESTCVECGAPVGGGSHALASGNRRVGGIFQDALEG